MKARIICIFTIVLVVNIFSGKIYGQTDTIAGKLDKKKFTLRDPEDNAVDLSLYLTDLKGVMPVPIIITEPAVGYGGGAALIYFHHRKKKYSSYVPPNLTGVAGFVTQNKTWGAAAFHTHVFGENRVRTTTALILPKVRYDYYGNNSELLSKHPVTVKLNSWGIFQQAQVRISDSKFYAGLAYMYFKSNVSLDTIPGKPLLNLLLKRLNTNSVISTVKPMVVYDSRNNNFTPTKGINSELSLSHSAKWLGSDDTYSTLKADFYGYLPISSKVFSGWRFDSSFMLGDGPFYAYPFVSLRGIPAMRYQSDNMLVLETEWRYNFFRRWSVIGFSGVGKAFENAKTFDEIDLTYTVGSGIRYKLARLLGIHSGLDFAMGNGKDFAFYIVFGSSW
ncbi:BamA/TamA family outer membrane protein [Carboxylicivirga taeanensis]|uniref:BamA/TamA family outer membrane protein n=1 Tax=Carboxylicivirga taeanensis TaxID=1416875 RepID=UPI003F6DB85C